MSGHAELVLAARLFGRLLLREVDADTLRELQQPDVAAALRALGVELPAESDLQALAADFFRCVLQPEGTPPPVHSLWREGRYHGEPAVTVQRIAQAAGFELAAAARNQPPDHLGCILLLWAELVGPRPDLAQLIVDEHLTWASAALSSAMRDNGFYGAISRATTSLIGELRSAQQDDPTSSPPATS